MAWSDPGSPESPGSPGSSFGPTLDPPLVRPWILLGSLSDDWADSWKNGTGKNRRKRRKGEFWEDRYYSTAIETGEHLMRCLVYIDLNMVRVGVVDHPSKWPYCGYNEIQAPRRKNIIIAYERLRQLAGFEDYESFASTHRKWVHTALEEVDPK